MKGEEAAMLLMDAQAVLVDDRRVALRRGLATGRAPAWTPRVQFALGQALVRAGARLLRDEPVPAGVCRR